MRWIPVTVVVLLGASPALAEAVRERPHDAITLKYLRSPAAASCPGPGFFREQVAQRLRYDLVSADAPEHLALRIARRAGRYRVEGEIRDQDGRVVHTPETIDDPSCVEAVKNMAILLAIHFTRDRIPPSPPPARVSMESTGAVTAPPRAEVPRPRLDLGLGSFAALDRAPAPAVGFAVSAAVRWSFFSIGLDWRALVPVSSDVRSESGDTARVRTSLITSDIAPCLHHRAVFFCTPLELGMRQFSADDTVRIDTRNPFSAGVGLRGGAEWVFAGRLGIRGSADLLTMWTQNVLTVESRDFWKTPLVAGVFAVSVTTSLDIGE